MRLDPVHDLQRVFRKLLAAMASPGTIVDLAPEAACIDLDLPVAANLLLVALTLLDGETRFSIPSADGEAASRTISRLTYAKPVPPGEADFLFVLAGGDLAPALEAARTGTLIDPDLGATLIVLTDFVEEGGSLRLSGPGIEHSARLGLGLPPGWVWARAARNREYPLGLDLLALDPRSRLVALPRTTLIEEGS